MSNEVYKLKQEWLERVMASDLTNAQKVFAFSIFKRAYGNKIESYPDTNDIIEDTGLSPSKFPAYRRALFACGAVEGVKTRRGQYKQENYTYTINLNWPGRVPSGSEPCTLEVEAVYPVGSSHVPGGYSNTTSNTPRKTTMNTTSDESNVASAPNDSCEDSLISEVKDDAYEYIDTLKVEDSNPFPNLKGQFARVYFGNSQGVTSCLTTDTGCPEPPLKNEKDFADGLKHLELLLRSRNISEEGQEAARSRYNDPEYRRYTSGMQRAGWAVGEVEKEEKVS